MSNCTQPTTHKDSLMNEEKNKQLRHSIKKKQTISEKTLLFNQKVTAANLNPK